MNGMSIIEVAIGLVFAYVLLSIFCSIINEFIAKVFSLRSENLQNGLKLLLSDPDMKGIAKKVWEHPLIKGNTLTKKGPSYIAAETFSRALIDIVDKDSKGAAKAAGTRDEIKAALENTDFPAEVKDSIKALIDDVNSNIGDLRKNLQVWFDNSMDRISGIFKRKLQKISIIVAAILAISFNVDTISISKELWKNPILRTQIADEVAVAVNACKDETNIEECPGFKGTEKIRKQLEIFPIGWSESAITYLTDNFLLKLIGLFLTTLAVSLGAPFWFDVLNQLNSFRSTGNKPKAST